MKNITKLFLFTFLFFNFCQFVFAEIEPDDFVNKVFVELDINKDGIINKINVQTHYFNKIKYYLDNI